MANNESERLFGLDAHEIDAVMEDINLHFSNCKFYYAVDSYDFVHFFFPYLDKIQFNQSNVTALAREGIAYDTFFSTTGNEDNGDILLLEEYKDELIAVRDVFFGRLERAYELTENIESLAKSIDRLIKENKSLDEIAHSNADLFFLLLIFLQRKEKKETNFVNFLRRKLYVDTFNTVDEEFNIYADEAFSQGYNSNFVERIFGLFQEKERDRIEKKKGDERERYLYNTVRDITAIEKVLTANKAIEIHPKYKNTVFYYLSSTPTKSRVLFELIHQEYGEELPHRSRFPSGKSVHRNIRQVFLLNILLREYPGSGEMPNKLLRQIKRSLAGSQAEEGSRAEDGVVTALSTLLGKISDSFESHFVGALFENYKEMLADISSGGMSPILAMQQSIQDGYRKIKEAKDMSILDDKELLEYNISRYGHLMRLRDEMIRSRSDDKILVTVEIHRGKDIVRLNYHHLPYLLFAYDQEMWAAQQEFYQAMDEISNIFSERASDIGPIVRLLEDLSFGLTAKDIKRQTIEFLMSIYIDLLAIRVTYKDPVKPKPKEARSRETTEEAALIKTLDDREKLFSRVINAANLTNDGKGGEVKAREVARLLRNEIYYVLLWICRRNNRFDRIREIEGEVLKKRPEDARLWHGLGLAYEAEFYHNGQLLGDKALIERSQRYLVIAERMYEGLLRNIPEKQRAFRNLVWKSMVGIRNSNCDSYLRLYEMAGREKDVTRARTDLNKLKDIVINDLKVDYDSIPIINHTEAELEYFETLILLEKGQRGKAAEKIVEADRRFQQAVTSKSFMTEESKEIGKKIARLRKEIGV